MHRPLARHRLRSATAPVGRLAPPRAAALVLLLLGMLAPARPAHADPGGYSPGPGDVLDIEVYAGGARQEAFSATITATRAISCPLLGELSLGECTVADVRARLAGAYGQGYYVRPEVLVNVSRYSGTVSVVGEVRRPGLYPLGSGLTLLGACELAGGPTDFAAIRHARVIRMEGTKTTRIPADLARIRQGKAPDIALRRDDRIEIPQRWF